MENMFLCLVTMYVSYTLIIIILETTESAGRCSNLAFIILFHFLLSSTVIIMRLLLLLYCSVSSIVSDGRVFDAQLYPQGDFLIKY